MQGLKSQGDLCSPLQWGCRPCPSATLRGLPSSLLRACCCLRASREMLSLLTASKRNQAWASHQTQALPSLETLLPWPPALPLRDRKVASWPPPGQEPHLRTEAPGVACQPLSLPQCLLRAQGSPPSSELGPGTLPGWAVGAGHGERLWALSAQDEWARQPGGLLDAPRTGCAGRVGTAVGPGSTVAPLGAKAGAQAHLTHGMPQTSPAADLFPACASISATVHLSTQRSLGLPHSPPPLPLSTSRSLWSPASVSQTSPPQCPPWSPLWSGHIHFALSPVATTSRALPCGAISLLGVQRDLWQMQSSQARPGCATGHADSPCSASWSGLHPAGQCCGLISPVLRLCPLCPPWQRLPSLCLLSTGPQAP